MCPKQKLHLSLFCLVYLSVPSKVHDQLLYTWLSSAQFNVVPFCFYTHSSRQCMPCIVLSISKKICWFLPPHALRWLVVVFSVITLSLTFGFNHQSKWIWIWNSILFFTSFLSFYIIIVFLRVVVIVSCYELRKKIIFSHTNVLTHVL